jgi:nucleoside-diphosphate-sugar epimerase
LLARGFTVRCYDDLSHGSREFVDSHIKDRYFEFYLEDVCDRRTLGSVLDGAAMIFHLAARKIPRYGDALGTLNVNNEGTRNVLELAQRQGGRVVLASTSDVYGKGKPPFKETDDLVIGASHIRRWSYAASKIFDEHLALGYHAERGLPVAVLRFFGSYGPRNHRSWWGGPQAVFIEQALKGEEITIHGDGSQTRSFTYIDDLIDGILLAAESDKATGMIINLGSDEEISILSLARLIWSFIRPAEPPRLKFIPYESFGGGYEDVTIEWHRNAETIARS